MPRPSEYTTAGVAMLISGVFNLWIGAMLLVMLIWLCVGVFWIFPILVGIAEIVTGARMVAGQRVHSAVPVAALGVFASCVNFNVMSLAAEIIALALVSSAPVSRWLAEDPEGAVAEW
jgi:hypothetical protein